MKIRKLTSLFTAIVMTLSLMVFSAPSANAAVVDSGETITITQKNQVIDSINYYGVTVNALGCPFKGRTPSEVWGDEWCCAAFVMKFYKQVYGIGVGNLNPSASKPKPSVYSGSGDFVMTSSPVVGDICGMPNHWAIVKQVLPNNRYVLIEQNWAWCSVSAPSSNSTPYGDCVTYAGRYRIVSGPDNSHWFWHYTLSKTNTDGPTSSTVTANKSNINLGDSVTFSFSGNKNTNYYEFTATDSKGNNVAYYSGPNSSYTASIYSCGTITYKVTCCNATGYKESSAKTLTVAHEYRHDHYLKEPTCTSGGAEILECYSCGDTKTQALGALGHDWEYWYHSDADMYDDGYDLYYCHRCGAEEKRNIVPSTGAELTVKTNGLAAYDTCAYLISEDGDRYSNWAEDDGNISFRAPKGKYSLQVMCDGYVTRTYKNINLTSNLTYSAKLAMPGDTDFDGKISATDVTAVSAHVKGVKLLSGYAEEVADANQDGKLSSNDVTAVSAHLKGLRMLW